MGSSGKGSGSSQALNYYGTVAGGICWGPIDTLYAIIINGGYLFQGTLSLTSDMTDLTGSLVDPSYLISGGYLRIYRGTETQPADGALSGHPPYLGTAYIVANGLFFGVDSGTCPNLQVIVGRTPRVSTTIVASADNITYTPTGGYPQVNPVAAWAELLTDERGLNIPLSKFDTTSWLASAHWCAQDEPSGVHVHVAAHQRDDRGARHLQGAPRSVQRLLLLEQRREPVLFGLRVGHESGRPPDP
jgi:hypothetical protein